MIMHLFMLISLSNEDDDECCVNEDDDGFVYRWLLSFSIQFVVESYSKNSPGFTE
jgi:hypothetical protein